jgi:hypothetical protein
VFCCGGGGVGGEGLLFWDEFVDDDFSGWGDWGWCGFWGRKSFCCFLLCWFVHCLICILWFAGFSGWLRLCCGGRCCGGSRRSCWNLSDDKVIRSIPLCLLFLRLLSCRFLFRPCMFRSESHKSAPITIMKESYGEPNRPKNTIMRNTLYPLMDDCWMKR